MLPQLLRTMWRPWRRSWSGGRKGSDGIGKWHRIAIQSQSVGQYVSRMQRQRGGKRARQTDTVPYSCARGANGLLSMSSLFSFSGLSSIQPLHRHSGWVVQQVCMWVCAHAGLCSVVINWRWSNEAAQAWSLAKTAYLANSKVFVGLAPCEDCAHAVMELIVSRSELFRPIIRTSQAWRPAEAAACS